MIIKIQNPEGRFSTGGSEGRVSFTKRGKVWSSLGYVKTHLKQHREASLIRTYKDCKIVMIDDENGYTTIELPFDEFLDQYISEREHKELDDKRKALVSRENYLKKEIKKLQGELEEVKQALSNSSI